MGQIEKILNLKSLKNYILFKYRIESCKFPLFNAEIVKIARDQ